MRSLLLLPVSALLLLSQSPTPTSALRFRCGVLGWLPNDWACKASCKVSGQKSGYCDDDGDCICNEKEFSFEDEIKEKMGDKNIFDYIKDKAMEWKDKVLESGIAQEVKKVVPSRCRLGNGFCKASCDAIGSVTGSCNDDFTDCTCSSEKVSPKQYALCLEEGICSLCCQRQGYGSGECRGNDGWDCKCISNDDRGEEMETDPNTDDYDFDDDFDISDIDVRRGLDSRFQEESFSK